MSDVNDKDDNELLQELEEKLQAATKESEERLAGWQRARADYQNLKRETEEREKRLWKESRMAFLREILPLHDHLRQAIESRPTFDDKEEKSWVEGIGKIASAWADLMKKWGVARVPGVGSPFDPEIHEAIEVRKNHEEDEADHVIQELSAGYVQDGVLLLPARVVVGKRSDAKDQPSINS